MDDYPPQNLEYEERFAFRFNYCIHLFDFKFKSHIHNFDFFPSADVTLGCNKNDELVVYDVKDKNCKVTVLSHQLKPVEKYEINSKIKKHPLDYLMDYTGNVHYNVESLRPYINSYLDLLPYDAFVHRENGIRKLHSMKANIVNVCYDKYDGVLILLLKHLPKYKFTIEMWKKETDEWVIIRAKQISRWMPSDYMTCGEKYLIITHQQYLCPMYIYNKYTFEDGNPEGIQGHLPVFFQDYKTWCQTTLKLLENIEAINKLSVDVLKIILSYVS